MSRQDLTFRLFVSSTFSDLAEERNALRDRVFPRLRALCERHGGRFQAVDLRWGVSDEAALDQQTMRICLHELSRAQRLSPRPNFLILLGQRYGWRPLPAAVPADEFEELLPHLEPSARRLAVWEPGRDARAEGWYQRDDNAVPPEYVLRARRAPDVPGARDAEAADWHGRIEPTLHAALGAAARALWPDPGDTRRRKYEDSATHQEIRRGALEAADPGGHVFAYFRTVAGLPGDARAAAYRDLVDGAPDARALARLDALKDDLRRVLPPENVTAFEARWVGGAAAVSRDHLGPFCARVEEQLRGVIERELADFREEPEARREAAAHRAFGRARCGRFTGREAELARIAEHVNGPGSAPLLVHGAAGSGKTALLAEAAGRAEGRVVTRFIGATPGSADLRGLLGGLCRELDPGAPVPVDVRELTDEFARRLAAAGPTVVFLDALDQLDPGEGAARLGWLPRELPPGAKLVVSALDAAAANGEAARNARTLVPPGNQVEVAGLPTATAGALLSAWLGAAGRTLQPDQRAAVLASGPPAVLPLALRLAFEEARRWRSFDPPLVSGGTAEALVGALLARLEQEHHHGRVLPARALSALAASRYGLTEDEVLDVLSADPDVLADFRRRSPKSPASDRLPAVVWSRLHADVEPYLSARRVGGGVVLTFYHRQIGEAVAARYLVGSGGPAAHARLASHFAAQDWWRESAAEQRSRAARLPPSARPANERKVDELPWHRIRLARLAGAWDELEAAFTELALFEVKAEAGRVFELAAELRDAAEALPADRPGRRALELLAEAVRRDAQFVARHPTTLFQCLWNSCWWYDCPDAARHYDPPGGVWSAPGPPWARPAPKLYTLLAEWRARRAANAPWARAARPPAFPLGCAQRAVFSGHTGALNGLAWSPDGTRLATASADRTARVWSADSGQELLRLEHRGPVTCVAWSPDGRRLATGAGDRGVIAAGIEDTVRVWDAQSGRAVLELKAPAGARAEEHEALFRYLPGLKPRDVPRGGTVAASCLAFSPDGRQLATGAPLSSVWVWDAKRGDLICRRGELRFEVRWLTFSPDGRLATETKVGPGISLWGEDGSETVIPLSTGNESANGANNGPPVQSARYAAAAFSADGAWLTTGTQVWDARTGQLVAELTIDSENGRVDVRAVAISFDGSRVVLGEADTHRYSPMRRSCAVRVWNWRNNEVTVRTGHDGDVTGVAFAPDGSAVVSCSDDGTVRVWDLGPGDSPPIRPDPSDPVRVTQFAPDGCTLAVDGSFRHPETGFVLGASDRPGTDAAYRARDRERASASFSADGRRFATGTSDGQVLISEVPSGAPVVTCAPASIAVADLPPINEWLQAQGPDAVLPQSPYPGYTDRSYLMLRGPVALPCPVRSTAFDLSGRFVAALDYDGQVRVWDATSGAELTWVPASLPGALWAERYEPDGRITAAHPNWLTSPAEDAAFEVLEIGGQPWSVLPRPDGGRVHRGGAETVVHGATGEEQWWLPGALDPLCLHPGGALVAGALGRRLELYALEGGPTAQPAPLVEYGERLLATARRRSRPLAAPPLATGPNTPLVCPRCGYRFDPEVVKSTRERDMRTPHEGASKQSEIVCPCGLNHLSHWPSRVTLFGLSVGIVGRSDPPPRAPDFVSLAFDRAFLPPAPSQAHATNPPVAAERVAAQPDARAAPQKPWLGAVRGLLAEGRPADALALLRESGARGRAADTARGVCLLRLGRAADALEVLRPLAIRDDRPRADVPPAILTNYATALLLDLNVPACERVLAEVRAAQPDAADRLADAIRAHNASRTWTRWAAELLGFPAAPVRLGYPPGELVEE